MDTSLPPVKNHIQVINLNYKMRWNLHKKSQTVKGVVHAKNSMKKLWNQRWQPTSGCDGRVMAKCLITTIQVNMVPIPSEAWRRQHKFAWIAVIKNFAIILPSQLATSRPPSLISQLFHAVFFAWAAPFFTDWLFLCRFLLMRSLNHSVHLW